MEKVGDFILKNVIIIGGGASGLMAAYAAASNGHNVTVIEKNEKLGKKIYITGKGRCNFTNDSSPEDFLQNVVRGEKFLRGVLYAFPPQKTVNFFENHGLSVKIERGNRVFPVSDHASDVTKTLEKACKNVGVSIRLNEKVEKIIKEEYTMPDIGIMSRVVEVCTNQGKYPCDYAIVATGGISYPSTGSTGDGYVFARAFGHTIVDTKSALCGINLQGDDYQSLQGLALKNVGFSVKNGEKTVFSEFGEALFTHFGVSGPVVLSASSVINRLPLPSLTIFFDLKPALDEQTLDKRILRDFDKYKNKQISNALCDLLPQKLISLVVKRANIDERKNVNVLTKEERLRLNKTIKNLSFKINSLRGVEEAIVTSGGVTLAEVNPKTMESKLIQGLKFCGEVLDIDAFTGGFNMQIAFSTGFAAGNTIK
ncbi:MAG: NAD(P)/FAD-dependent oxidoreductase [Clostridiales bacterium]|nr:NAD(P)/FAD-dependent oxidoreductase [Clostridiales bacterium]